MHPTSSLRFCLHLQSLEQREKGPEKIFEEIIVKKFPNMGKEIATQVQEVQRVPGRINPMRNTLGHIVIKLTKIKEKKIIKSNKGKMTKKHTRESP